MGIDNNTMKQMKTYLFGNFDIDFLGMFFKLAENLVDVLRVSQSDEDLDLHRLDVDWIVEVAEEKFNLFLNDYGSFLENQIDIFQCDKHNLWFHIQK